MKIKGLTINSTDVKIILVLFFVAVAAEATIASPTIDGKVGAYSEYSRGYYVEYFLEGNPSNTVSGQLWTAQDSNYFYMGFVEPLALVDNSYGKKDGSVNNSVDWWKDSDPRLHKFDELRGSDKAGFLFSDGSGNQLLNIDVDYIEGFGTVGDKNDKKRPPFASGGVTDGEGGVFAGGRDDKGKGIDKIDDWSGDISAATSLEYNYNLYKDTELFSETGTDSSKYLEYYYSPETSWDGDPLDYSPTTITEIARLADAYTPVNSDYSEWIFDVAYELKINKDLLPGFSYDSVGGMETLIAHVSPSKSKYLVSGGFEEIPHPVPTPSAVLLGGLGLSFVSWLRRGKSL